MNIYIRGERRWQKKLAQKMSFSISDLPEKNVSSNNDGLISSLKYYNKKLSLPSIEWLFDVTDKVDCDLYIESGSRVLKTSKNYATYVENGVGVFSYNLGKNNCLNRFIINKLVSKDNFKGFVFYSESSRKSFINCFSGNELFIEKAGPVIYPLVDVERKKSDLIKKRIGFCSSNFYLKGGAEVLSVAKRLPKLSFDIITNISKLTEETLNNIPSNINLIDFNLTDDEFINHAVDNWDIYLHATFFDTVPLTPLEMIKCGIPVISTDTFAISEYVVDGVTGITINNNKNPFNSDFLPNKKVKYLGDVIHELSKSGTVDEQMVGLLEDAINELYSNYNDYTQRLDDFLVETECFSVEYIKKQWLDFFNGKI